MKAIIWQLMKVVRIDCGRQVFDKYRSLAGLAVRVRLYIVYFIHRMARVDYQVEVESIT